MRALDNPVGRLQVREVLRARWFAGAVVLAALLVGFFGLVAARESLVVGFTGFGRVMSGVVLASLVFQPLLAVFSTTQAVPGARQQGALEWYLSHPVSPARCFWGLYLPRVAAVGLPALVAVAVLQGLAAALGAPVGAGLLGQFLALLLGQTLCFSALGMGIGVIARSPEQALMGGLSLWAASAALVDFVLLGLLLRWDVPPQAVFLLAVLNPMQSGRVALLAGLDPGLGTLGPVGTWAATTLGPAATIAFGLLWPVAVGAAALAVSRWAFLRSDAI